MRGLQHIYIDHGLRKSVFAILEEVIPDRVGAEGKATARRRAAPAWRNGRSLCSGCCGWG